MKIKRNEYDFCLFSIKKDWARVIWEVTNACNYECSYCIFSSHWKDPIDELPTESIIWALQEMYENGYRYLKITWGEPFVRKDLPEIIHFASQLWYKIDISTNASLITESVIKKIQGANIEYIHISLDGCTKEMQEMVRWKWTFLPTVRGIKLFKKYWWYVRIWTVLHRSNEYMLSEIIDFVISLWSDEVIFSFMEPVWRMRHDQKSPLLATRSAEECWIEITSLQEKIRKLEV